MQITDPKLFKAIETAIASGNTVYLVSPDYQSIGDGPELIRNSTLIKGRHGEFPADAFHTANSDQFLRALKRYARFECEGCGRSCRDEYYMLRSELWQKVCPSNDTLCIGCVEDRLGRKLVPTDFNLEDTHNLIKLWPPARRLKERLGVGWYKYRNRVLAFIRAKVLALSAEFLSVMRRAFTAARRAIMAWAAGSFSPKAQSDRQSPKGQRLQPEPQRARRANGAGRPEASLEPSRRLEPTAASPS
jgi:hypothetical protein